MTNIKLFGAVLPMIVGVLSFLIWFRLLGQPAGDYVSLVRIVNGNVTVLSFVIAALVLQLRKKD